MNCSSQHHESLNLRKITHSAAIARPPSPIPVIGLIQSNVLRIQQRESQFEIERRFPTSRPRIRFRCLPTIDRSQNRMLDTRGVSKNALGWNVKESRLPKHQETPNTYGPFRNMLGEISKELIQILLRISISRLKNTHRIILSRYPISIFRLLGNVI